jgi:hypothetical protein
LGGGGGGDRGGQPTLAGNGGSGICILSYISDTPYFTGGDITTNGANTVHTFTANGVLLPL